MGYLLICCGIIMFNLVLFLYDCLSFNTYVLIIVLVLIIYRLLLLEINFYKKNNKGAKK